MHNFPAYVEKASEVEREFLKNARHRKPRKNGVVLFHEVLSFHEADASLITPEILRDIARYYLGLRAPEALAYGVVHGDAKNPHIHLVISGNLVKSNQCLRLSRSAFARAKQETERYQRGRYPLLKHSLVQERRQETERGSVTVAEMARDKRLSLAGVVSVSRKEEVRRFLLRAMQGSPSESAFLSLLEREGYRFYVRGKHRGVEYQGRKYRFKTLGIEAAYSRAQEGWASARVIKQRLDGVSLEAFRKKLRGLGFVRRIRDILAGKRCQVAEVVRDKAGR